MAMIHREYNDTDENKRGGGILKCVAVSTTTVSSGPFESQGLETCTVQNATIAIAASRDRSRYEFFGLISGGFH